MSDSFSTSSAPQRITRTAEDILARYSSGERDFQRTDLPEGSSFAGSVLAGSNFEDSWLSETDFSRADLRNTCFDESNVKCCDFRGADLRGTTIRESVICGSNFEGAQVDEVRTEGTTWYGANVSDLHVLAEVRK